MKVKSRIIIEVIESSEGTNVFASKGTRSVNKTVHHPTHETINDAIRASVDILIVPHEE